MKIHHGKVEPFSFHFVILPSSGRSVLSPECTTCKDISAAPLWASKNKERTRLVLAS